MATTAAAALVVIGASAVVGHALWRLAGLPRSWAAPAAGLALLVSVAAVGVELPGRSATAAVLLAVIVAASAFAIRRDVTVNVAEAGALALAVLALTCIPFAVTGHAGVLGIGVNNDMDPHLTAAWWLQTHAGVSKLAPTGYPLGPHALAAALGTGLRFSIPASFTGIAIAAPALASLAAFAALRGTAAAARWAGAVLVGIAYLASAYLAQGAFKETLQALFVLAFAVALREVQGPRSGLVLGVLAAGMVSTYSYFGVLWPLATVVVLAVLQLARTRGAPLRRALPVAAAAVTALVVLAAGQAGRMADFSGSHYAHEQAGGHGNLYHALSPFEALGVWPSGDFRFDPQPFWPTEVLIGLACLSLALAVASSIARRDLAIPAALGGAALVYWQAALFKNPYDAAKALAVAGPLVALAIVVPGAAFLRERGRRRVAAIALGLAFAVPAAVSGVLALRDARVGPAAHARELDILRRAVGRSSVLFLVSDDLARWELRGARVATVRRLYATWVVPMRAEKPWKVGGLIDFDSVSPATLDEVRYVITTSSGYASSAPPNFTPVRRTRSYVLWRRDGPTAPRSVLQETGAPGAALDCGADRSLVRSGGVAAVLPAPVVQTSWRGTTRYAGESARTSITLPRGTWDLSLQFIARQGLRVSSPLFGVTVPANLDRFGPYWPVATVRVARPTTLPLRVTSGGVTWFGRLLGARGETRGPRSQPNLPLGTLAATRHGVRPRLVPLRRACGRYVDWYRLSGATS